MMKFKGVWAVEKSVPVKDKRNGDFRDVEANNEMQVKDIIKRQVAYTQNVPRDSVTVSGVERMR